MAIYSKLLLSAGGGVISTRQQAEQAKNTATLLIGLGGTGVSCLRTIKTQVRERLKPDDPEAAVVSYSHIRFLGVDSAEKTQGTQEASDDPAKADALAALDDTEFFSIANPNVKRAFQNQLALKQRAELTWLDWEKIPAPDLSSAGAGGIRQVGRYMLMDKSQAFMNRIESEINAAKSGLAQPTVNVHIFAGLSGGTGAGCFLDVCYMVRSISERIGGVTIFGYFFLPDVNLARIPFSDTKTRSYIPKNGYASLQELDYCMQLQFNGGSFVQEYQGHNIIEWKKGPVDMCHLICATNSAGDVIPNAYEYAMNVAAEYIMDFLTLSDEEFDISQQLSNFGQKVRQADSEKIIGSNLAYCVIGASCASIPLREINTYLASELFNRFSQIGGNIPTESEVEQLVMAALAKNASSWKDVYESLYREIRNKADDNYDPYTDDWQYVRDYGNSNLVTQYTNQTARKLNAVEANAKSMVTAENEESLIKRIRTQMDVAQRDINRGPIYAYRMLSAAQNRNMLNNIDGLIAENDARWTQEAAQAELRKNDYENAKSNFERPRGLLKNNAKNFQTYEYYLMLFEQHKLAMEVYKRLDKCLKEFKRQIEEITASYFAKLARVTETLMNTFKENRDALAGGKIMQAVNSFSIPMMTIAELKKSLDAEIEKINIPGMLDLFMGMLIANESEWISEDENKIARLVTKFFVDTAFGGFANRTITAFLKDKYGIDNDGQLADKIYNDWMKTLTARAKPLFYFNDSIWKEDQTSKLAFLSIPKTSAPIKTAAQKMYNTNNLWKNKESALTDRIYVMCSACALPLSAYSNCSDYERICFSATETGRHYYEGKAGLDMAFSDWNKLPSLTPQSLLMTERAPEDLKKLVESGRSLYESARSYNIFDSQNRICRPDPAAVAALKKMIGEAKDITAKLTRPEGVTAAAEFLGKLESAMQLPMIPTDIAMPNDGFAGKEEIKRTVQKDHFVSSPVFQITVEKIIAELGELKAMAVNEAAKLRERIVKVSEGGKEIDNYCDALFTGVLSVEGRVITYYKSEYGISSDITLSKRGAEFPFSAIPLYQAFLSFQQLEGSVKEDIKKLIDSRYNSDDPKIHETGVKLKDELSEDKVSAWAQMAANFEQRADILELLTKVKKRFSIFCLEYGI